MKKILIRLLIFATLAAAGWGGYKALQQLPQRQQQIATAKAVRGDVVVRSFTRGELRAVRSALLIAPNLFGTVQVTRLAELGSLAKEKDLIVEFDDSEVNSRLEEKQLEIDQVEEQIKKAQADLEIRNNQDQVDLLRARFAVRRAELEVKRNELLSAIDQKKNVLNLEESKRRLQQLESDIESRREQAKAEIAVLMEQKNKANLELAREKMRLSQVKLLSPIGGLVAIKQNRQGGFFFPGMTIPDIREGDQVQPGMPIAEILDLSELEIIAKVGELDRANLKEGQDALLRFDAVGGKTFHGKIKSMSGTASANIFSGDPGKKFDVVFSLDMKELLTNLGAKPEQIRRILAATETNRKKPLPQLDGMASPGSTVMTAASAPDRAVGGLSGAPGAQPMAGGKRGAAIGGTPMRASAARPGQPPALPNQDALMRRPPGQSAATGGSAPGLTPGAAPMFMPATYGFQFSERDMANAQLPPPVNTESQLDVLLRPGLLADVEIIVEKLPNVVHIPAQAVFEKGSNQIVYVKNGSRWDERIIKPSKRTESTMIVASGLQPGEVIAVADPNAKPGDKNKKREEGGGPMNGMPGAKGGS